ncbi:MAG: Cell wall surface anchor family protein, partial [Parcubacteria group bacterium GW2011_GWA1_47_10]
IGTATPDSIKLDVEDDIEIGTGTTGCVRDADNTTLVGSCVSDERLKKNITTLSADTLEKITRLRPVTFEWRNDEYSWLNGQSGVNYGLIAQEVEQVFPDMVNTDEKGFKRVSYDISLTMRLLEAVQELYTKLFALKDEMLALKNTVLAFADRFVSREIVATEKICIGATCMNEQQLIDLLASTGVVTYAQTMEQPIPSEPADSTATSSPASDGTSGAGDVATTTESVVEEPVASSTEPVVEEPVVEVVSEPAPEPAPEPTPTEPAGEPVAVTQ